jgi:hypothetical protein
LEFSPEMAGQDVTPANLDFAKGKLKFKSPTNQHPFSLADTLGNLAKNAVKQRASDFTLLLNEPQSQVNKTKGGVRYYLIFKFELNLKKINNQFERKMNHHF